MNFLSALIATHVGSAHLNKNGLLLMTGAQFPFFNIDPEFLTYSLSKNLVHNLHLNATKHEKFQDKSVITILPTMIDSPSNRKGMPDADTSTWLPPEKIADLLYMWASTDNRPKSGAFVELTYENDTIDTKFH